MKNWIKKRKINNKRVKLTQPNNYGNSIEAGFLKSAVKQSAKNIGVIGPNGSGKSSIIQSFLKSFNGKYRVVSVSSNPSKQYKSENNVGQTIRHYEQNILQQLLLSGAPSKFIHSKIQRIPSKRERYHRIIAGIFIYGLVCSLCVYLINKYFNNFLSNFLNNSENEISILVKPVINNIYNFLTNNSYILFGLSALFIVILMNSIYKIIKMMSVTRLKVGGMEIESKDLKNALIDRFTKELIYYIKTAKIKVIVFEDLDRIIQKKSISKQINNFQSTQEILYNLKELNEVLNKQMHCRVTFIYALSNKILENLNTQSKFFDYVLSVSNESLKTPMIKEIRNILQLNDFNSTDNLRFVETIISLVEHDMRSLIFTRNEYIYLQRKYNIKIEKDSEKRELLAISLYRMKFPEDFNNINNEESVFYNIVEKTKDISNKTSIYRAGKDIDYYLFNEKIHFESNISQSEVFMFLKTLIINKIFTSETYTLILNLFSNGNDSIIDKINRGELLAIDKDIDDPEYIIKKTYPKSYKNVDLFNFALFTFMFDNEDSGYNEYLFYYKKSLSEKIQISNEIANLIYNFYFKKEHIKIQIYLYHNEYPSFLKYIRDNKDVVWKFFAGLKVEEIDTDKKTELSNIVADTANNVTGVEKSNNIDNVLGVLSKLEIKFKELEKVAEKNEIFNKYLNHNYYEVNEKNLDIIAKYFNKSISDGDFYTFISSENINVYNYIKKNLERYLAIIINRNVKLNESMDKLNELYLCAKENNNTNDLIELVENRSLSEFDELDEVFIQSLIDSDKYIQTVEVYERIFSTQYKIETYSKLLDSNLNAEEFENSDALINCINDHKINIDSYNSIILENFNLLANFKYILTHLQSGNIEFNSLQMENKEYIIKNKNKSILDYLLTHLNVSDDVIHLINMNDIFEFNLSNNAKINYLNNLEDLDNLESFNHVNELAVLLNSEYSKETCNISENVLEKLLDLKFKDSDLNQLLYKYSNHVSKNYLTARLSSTNNKWSGFFNNGAISKGVKYFEDIEDHEQWLKILEKIGIVKKIGRKNPRIMKIYNKKSK